MENKEIKVTRGELYMANLPEETVGSVQAGKRPVLVTQSNWLNAKSPTFLAAIVTSKLKKTHMDTHVVLPQIPGLPKKSMVEAEQRYAVDKAQSPWWRRSSGTPWTKPRSSDTSISWTTAS